MSAAHLSSKSKISTIRLVVWAVAAFAVAFVLLALLPMPILQSLLVSDRTRIAAETALAQSIGMHGQFAEFSRSNDSLHSARYEGVAGNAKLLAEDIRAVPRLVGWPGGTLRLDGLTIRSAKITINEKPLKSAEDKTSTTAKEENSQAMPPWLKLLLPARFEMSPATIHSGNVEMYGLFALRGFRARISIEGKGVRIRAEDATISSPWPGSWRVDLLDMLAIGGELRLVSLQCRLDGTDATATATGNWSGHAGAQHHILLKRVPLAVLLPDYSRKVSGELGADLQVRSEAADGLAWSVGGDLDASGTRLTNMDALATLARLAGDDRLHSLDCQVAKAHINYDYRNGETQITDITIESLGLLRVEGRLSIQPDRSIDGALDLGMAPSLLKSIPGAKSFVFTTRRGDYLWTPVRVSGSLDSPETDLPARLAAAIPAGLLVEPAAAANKVGETVTESTEGAARKAGSLLKDAGSGVLDLLLPRP